MTEIKCRITNNKFISAIYFALLQCGYDYHLIGKEKSLENEFSDFYKKENFPQEALRLLVDPDNHPKKPCGFSGTPITKTAEDKLCG